jgi:glycosyltransferase involved in cell wall biosynthesis
MPKPLLLISDAISCSSGLGRITRDLAVRVHENLGDVYRVGTAGYGGPGSSKYPFPQYHFHSVDNWQLPELPIIARDFFGDDEPIILFVWDLSRLAWFADARQCPLPHVRRWLESTAIRKWLYHPIDADGPNGKLSAPLAQTMKGFDRVLDYTAFSCGVTGNTEHLPHGIDTKVFQPHDRVEAKRAFRKQGFMGLRDDSFLVGIVATNQARKDWALGIQTCRILLDRGLDVKVWCHIDTLDRFWSLPNLITDYGLQGRVVITTSNFTDEQMNWMYAACDITLGIGLGEGMGYPIFESLASGVPVVHGDYAGAAEFLPPSMKVKPIAFKYEGPYCCKRPAFNPEDWADCAEEQKGITASLPSELDWNGPTLWPRWKSWFERGAK